MGTKDERGRFLGQVRKACAIGQKLRDLGIRKYGVVGSIPRRDQPYGQKSRQKTQSASRRRFSEACTIAEGYGERLAAEGEICWGGMHGWKHMVDLLEMVDRPKTLGFQADMAHTMLYTLGYNSPESRVLPMDYDWSDDSVLTDALRQVANALAPMDDRFPRGSK